MERSTVQFFATGNSVSWAGHASYFPGPTKDIWHNCNLLFERNPFPPFQIAYVCGNQSHHKFKASLHFHCWHQLHWDIQKALASASSHHILGMSDRGCGKTPHACSLLSTFWASSNVSPGRENNAGIKTQLHWFIF